MKISNSSRREFIRKTLISTLTLTYIGSKYSCSKSEMNDNYGEKTALLGNTGVTIPRITLGLGSRFCSIDNEEQAHELLIYALDNGLYSWDTAHSYINTTNGVISEERVGAVLSNRRKEVFLSSKVANRNPDIAIRQVAISLERLKTDYFDNLLIHDVNSVEDVENICKSGGLLDLFEKLKNQNVTKFIGFSSHSNTLAAEMLIDRGNFDTALIAMNHLNPGDDREERLIPKAKERGIGLLLMKVLRPKESLNSFKADDLIKYALSINGPSGLVIGVDSLQNIYSNIEILNSIRPLTMQDSNKLSKSLILLNNSQQFEWIKPHYEDGNWK
jgi:uncharacterized protein